MTTSKSFRAVLPILSDEELQRLRAWSEENCAAASIFRDDNCVIWLASKERARSREAFMRFCRSTLQRLAIRARPCGRWFIEPLARLYGEHATWHASYAHICIYADNITSPFSATRLGGHGPHPAAQSARKHVCSSGNARTLPALLPRNAPQALLPSSA